MVGGELKRGTAALRRRDFDFYWKYINPTFSEGGKE